MPVAFERRLLSSVSRLATLDPSHRKRWAPPSYVAEGGTGSGGDSRLHLRLGPSDETAILLYGKTEYCRIANHTQNYVYSVLPPGLTIPPF